MEQAMIYGYSSTRMKIRDVFREFRRNGYTKTEPFAIGRNEKRMTEYASANDITLGSKSLYFTSKSIAHPNRSSKERKKLTIPAKSYEDFPQKRKKMDLYWDGDAFVYTDYREKFIIKPNYEVKFKTTRNGKKHVKKKKVCLVTAGKVRSRNDFNASRYRKV